ncbi:hypothetical protein [Novosphingobium sp. KN65.2]|uniref:gp53-like domain-containing protein n=1 Tax=Novosphingobium sp. KN65.2 TaxID=1478134 RepID=UPI0005DE6F69|nr:hypothetical protein [Novosphingobium sp. KN65.2]CDO37276.1 hypothetical protein SPHV1_310049 [Novosphingobium sp. KN65.2]
MPFNMIVTDAGRAALVNAANTGTAPVTIAQVGLTETAVTPDVRATNLPGEFKRIATLSGDVVADDTIHLIVRDETADVFTVRSLALYLGDGTLFAIYGQADVLVEKSAQALMLLAIDVQFADIDAAALTFGDANFLNPPATTSQQGVVELATTAEAQAGIDALRALTPAAAKAAILGWLLAQDGSGSGLDADLLDGQQGAYYLPTGSYTAGDVRSKLLTVDGSGSGLDADLLDGLHGSAFARMSLQNVFTVPQIFDVTGSQIVIHYAGANAPSTIVRADANNFYLLLSDAGAEASGTYNNLRPFNITLATGLVTMNNGLEVKSSLTFNGATVWHAANDGAGSGLDADLLDGVQGSFYARTDAANVFADYLRIKKTTSQEIRLDGNAGPSWRMISTINGSSPNSLILQYSGDYFASDFVNALVATYGGSVSTATQGILWGQANDGSGSGLDADMLDGQQASAFAQLSANNEFSGSLSLVNTAPRLVFNESDEGVNGKIWDIRASSGLLQIRALNDAQSSASIPLQITRSGNSVTAINFAAASVTAGGNEVWNAGNDGSGSGLDADTVDGYQASALAKVADFAADHSATGYQKLTGGLLMQWGRINLTTRPGYGVVTFPIAFSAAPFYVDSGCATEVGNADAQGNGPLPYGASATNMNVYNAAPGGGNAWWIAIGKV